jgi:ribosomal protein S18 acetylase RimI-like enzyme
LHQIKKASIKDAKILSKIAKTSFLPAHGHSAPKKDIDNYLAENFSEENFIKELSDSKNEYHLFYVDDKIAGYSKIIFDQPNGNIAPKNVTYMSRLYFLKEFYGLGFGKELFDFNIKLCKENKQSGIWLAVWLENQKGISFYKKMGFKKVGDFDFEISATHSNPNHILYLEF